MDISTCNTEIVAPRALKAPFTRSLYDGAREIEPIVVMNTQTGNWETLVTYENDVITDRKSVYTFIGKYKVEPIENNKQIKLTEYE